MSRVLVQPKARQLGLIIAGILLGLCPPALLSQTMQGPVDVFARGRYFYVKRAGGPGKTIPANAYANAVREYGRMVQSRSISLMAAPTPWTSVNPSGMVYQVTGANFIAGRTNSMAFHPSVATTFYCAAAGGGVWKTTDGGSNWTALTDLLATLMSGCIAIDPQSPNTLYYGTGEQNFSIDSYYGSGIFKSTDAGSSWTNIVGTSVGSYISQIAVNPANSNVVYSAGNLGVYKSTDAGLSWVFTGSVGNAFCIIIDPTDANVLFTTGLTSGFFSAGVIQKSTNGGASWSTLTSGLPASNAQRTQLAMAPSDHLTLYASITNASTYALLGLYKTTDGGGSWNLVSSSPNYLGDQGWYANAISVKPTDPATVIVGGLDNYRSTNSGASFTQVSNWSTPSSANFTHADVHFLGYNGTNLYCGSDGGVYQSTNDGATWSDLNATLATLQFQSGDYDPTNLLRLYGGCQDNNKQTSTNGGAAWIQRATGDGGYTLVDPGSTNIIYGQYVNGSIQRSTNFGVTFNEIHPAGATGGLFYSPYELAPGDPNTLVFGTSELWKTTAARTETGSTWAQIASSSTVGGNVSAVAISSTNTNKIYFGTNLGHICSTINNGATWTTVTGFPYVSDLAVDPSNDNTCYATVTGFNAATHVLKTTDGGSTWNSITNNLPNIPCNTIVFVPQSPPWLFVGTDLGVYYSTDAGSSWAAFNSGLPTLTIDDLKFKSSTNKLMVATHGRGCYMNDLALPINVVPKFFLEGPFIAAADTMGNQLRNSGYLAAHFTGAAIHARAVDSVTVEIRDSAKAATSTKQLFSPAWLLTDGTVRSFTDSTQPFVTFITPMGYYHIVVHHRNHLAVMSKDSVLLSAVSPQYDFTTAQSKGYGSSPMILVGTKYCLLSGDADGSGDVTILDRAAWRTQNSQSGYLSADMDLSGDVTILDRVLWRANNSLSSQVP